MRIHPAVLKDMNTGIVVGGKAGEDVEEPGLCYYHCMCVYAMHYWYVYSV